MAIPIDISIAIKRLDIVLKYLANDRGNSTVTQMQDGLYRNGIHFDQDELYRHLNQLIVDRYVKEWSSAGIGHYSILTSGVKLSSEGGYEATYNEMELRKEEAAANRELAYQQGQIALAQLQVSQRMFWTNAMIAGATVIAAVYYFFELLRVQYHLGLPNHIYFP